VSQAIIHLNEPLSPPRIGGIAAALAIHVAALMMLMAPMTYAPPMPITEEQPFVPEDIKPIIPDRPKPAPIDKKDQITPVVVPLVLKQAVAPVELPPIVLNEGSSNDTPYIEAPTSGEPALPFIAPPSGPISLSTEYAPAPNYPIASLRNGEEGTVLLLVKVDATGKPIDVTLKKSSGYRELDKNAMKHVLATWRFHPAMHQGLPIPALALVPVNYKIN
jgi:periplasmic protein TonB